MSIKKNKSLRNIRLVSLAISCVLPLLLILVLILGADSSLRGDDSPQNNQQPFSAGHQLVLLLDTNPHQKNVLAVELALAEGIIQKLNQSGNTFSVITFGSEPPALLKSGVAADEAIEAIRGVSIEQTRDKYFSVRFYDALDLALRQFASDALPESLLVISEGHDYLPGKTFKQTVVRAEQLHVACDVAMVADHTLYGTKAIQRYGFDLRRLAAKTHGRYVEVGGGQKRTLRSADQLSESILNRDRGQ